MNKKPVRYFLSLFASALMVHAAYAENSATFTLTTPRYYKDGIVVFCDDIYNQPDFVSGTRGTFTVFQDAPVPTSSSYVATGIPAGYYVSKWQLCTAGGGTVIQSWENANSITVTFDYKWAVKYGTWLELYAHLSPISYTVSYDTNGGAWTTGEPSTGPWDYAEGGAVPGSDAITRFGYTLSGWKSGTGKTLEPGETFTGASLGVTANEQDIGMTAQWSAGSYSVTLHKNGGTCLDLTSYTYGIGATLPTATKDGYDFGGWYENADFSGDAVTAISKTDTGDKSFYAKFTAATYALRLEMSPGVAKICYQVGAQSYYDETTASCSILISYGTTWRAYAEADEGCSTNETCAASGTMGTDGAVFRPRVNVNCYPLTLTPGTGIAGIFYKTNAEQAAWCRTDREVSVPVPFGDTWSAYAVAAAGYSYAVTSEAAPKTGVMTTAGDAFKPEAAANAIWVSYNRNGGGDAGRMDDSEFAYGVEAPLRLNSYARTYEIHYNGNGGSAHENDVSGYTFARWCDTPEGLKGTGHYSYADGERVTNPCGSTGASKSDPVILYAQWAAKTVALPTSARSGYDFSGWYTQATGGQRVGGAGDRYFATDNITLYAHWRAHVTQLAFVVDDEEKSEFAHAVANGGTYEDFGSLPELTSDDPTKAFAGWYTAPEGGTKITDTTTVNLTDSTLTLYAQWEKVVYKITYMADGGTIVEDAKQSYTPGQSFGLPTNVTLEDRTFLGWYDNPTFEGKAVRYISSTDTGDKTFYAKWSEVSGDTITLTFVNVSGYSSNTTFAVWDALVNPSTPMLKKTYESGAKNVTLPDASFSQEGFTQVGWRLAGDEKTNPSKWDTYKTGYGYGTVTEDLTFHTIWETNTYTIVYDGNGGTNKTGKTEHKRDVLYGATADIFQTDYWFHTNNVNLSCVGWAFSPTGHAVYTGGEIVSNLTAEAKGSVRLYAVWEDKSASNGESEESAAPNSTAAPSFAAVPSPAPVLAAASVPMLAAANEPTSYTLHFSPGAVVVNPQAMANLTCSGTVTLPDCLYTNVQGSTFAGWDYDGKLITGLFSPQLSFNGQIVTVTATWKPLACGDLSTTVGLTNAVLKESMEDEAPKWETNDEYSYIIAADTPGGANALEMTVLGSGRLTYEWRVGNGSGLAIASNVIDGVATNITVEKYGKYWYAKSIDVAGSGWHHISWMIPQQDFSFSYFLRNVRWEPEVPKYTLTAEEEPDEAGAVTVDPAEVTAGETATLTATPADGYVFVQWNDGSTSATNAVTVWGDITTYVAKFKRGKCALKVGADPEEGGKVTGAGSYEYGTETTLTAAANEGYEFVQWSDGATENPHTITVVCETNLTATFQRSQYPLVLTVGEGVEKIWYKIGNAEAQSTATSLSTNVAYGTDYKLWADAKYGYALTGSGSSEANAVKGTVGTESISFNPEPTRKSYSVTAAADPSEGGTVTGTNTYEYGATTNLMARANLGWSFAGWSDGATESNRMITVLCETNLTATFQRNNYPLILTVGEGVEKIWYQIGDATEQSTSSTLTNSVAFGTTFNLWADAKEGYNPQGDGWSRENPVSGAMGTDGYEFQPDPSKKSYTVQTLSSPKEGGTVKGAGSYEYDTEATLTAAANEGYEFVQWSDGATENPHTITVVCATNLTAKFQRTSGGGDCWYAAFDGNGKTAGEMAEQTNVCGVATSLAANAFKRTGYVFDHWEVITGNEKGKTYTNCAEVTDLATANRAALLKAVWKAAEYRIDFDPNGGRGAMNSVRDCSYGIRYQLPACTFTCDKMTNSGWATSSTGAVVYVDGAWVSKLSETGGVVTLYAVWGGTSEHHVYIKGHTATKRYTGLPFTVSGYDVELPSTGYYEKDFTTKPGVTATIVATDVAKYKMGLSEESFTNLVPSVKVHFHVTNDVPDRAWDGWLKILPSKIGGEPLAATGSKLSAYDCEVEYGKKFDGSTISNAYVAVSNAYDRAVYDLTGLEYAATEDGSWSTNAPVFTAVGTTSIWYRVSAKGYDPYAHEVAVNVIARSIKDATVSNILDQTWTGKPLTPEVAVEADGKTLEKGVDYYLTYENNIDVGEATVHVHGKGNWQETVVTNFYILPKALPRTRVTITGHTATNVYDGKPHTASGYDFVSTNGAYTAADFACTGTTTVTQTAVGTAVANLKAADFVNLNDGFDVEFVVARDISVTVTAGEDPEEPGSKTIPGEPGSGTVPAGGLSKFDVTAVYDGQPHTVDGVALLKAYADLYAGANVAFGTTAGGPWGNDPIAITDVGTTSFWYRVQAANYEPFVHAAKVTVTPRDLAKATVEPISDQAATGELIEPEVTVTDGTPSIITADDYDVAYSDNVAVGTATVTLTGKRNYTGTKTATFNIVDATEPGHYVSAYGETVSIDLQADFPDQTIKSVSGLPSGLKYNKSTGLVTGKSTKAVTDKKVTVTFTDRTKTTIYWTVKAGENNGVTIDFGESATGETSATASVGTIVEWTVEAAESGAKVTVSKLPTGLKYNKTTGLITGTPTKAKTYAMTVKTVVNGQTVTQTFDIEVEALPAMLVGTYYGAATVDGIAGQFQLKLAATGKATGYFYAAGKKITLKSTALVAEGEDCYTVSVAYTYNRVKYADEILLMKAATVEDADIWAVAVGLSDVLEDVDARRDTIKECFGKVVAKTTAYDVLEKTEDGEYLKAKVTTVGAVTVSGKLLNAAGKLTSVSCSTHLVVDDAGMPYCHITIYKKVSNSDPIVYDEVWYLPED